MTFPVIHTCPEMMEFISEVGFLPLLDSGINGFSAKELAPTTTSASDIVESR